MANETLRDIARDCPINFIDTRILDPANSKKAGFFCDCADSLVQDSTCPFRRTEGQS
jgi:hypothetical protein